MAELETIRGGASLAAIVARITDNERRARIALRPLALAFVLAAFAPAMSPAAVPPVFVRHIGAPGSGSAELNGPRGIACDDVGTIYVADYWNNRVQVFAANGTHLRTWGSFGTGNGQFQGAVAIAVNRAGTRVYVLDRTTRRVQRFSATGSFQLAWGSSGAGNDQFMSPAAIALDPSGNVYVTDTQLDRVQKFDADGNYLLQWNAPITPAGIAVDAQRHVFVVDQSANHVTKYDSTGVMLLRWNGRGTPQGQLQNPSSVAVDASGFVWVVEEGQYKANKFAPDSTFIVEWGGLSTFDYPRGIAVDAQGRITIIDHDDDQLDQFHQLPPVALVHGVCSSSAAWNTLAQRLRDDGFTVYSDLSFVPNGGHPADLVDQLTSYLETIPEPKVDVVAHSMGGLVTRDFIRRRAVAGTPIPVHRLITLGTPHHGSDIAAWNYLHPKLRRWLSRIPSLYCALASPAFLDLLPGSAFLNQLNYGRPGCAGFDVRLGHSSALHHPECLDGGVPVYTLAGIRSATGIAGSVGQSAWITLTGLPYPNDGLVGVNSAHLSNPAATRVGSWDVSHSADLGPSLPEDMAVADAVVNTLKGLPVAPPFPTPMESAVAALGTPDDTTEVDLAATEGVVAAGATVEVPVALPAAGLARFLLAAGGGVALKLRAPSGTLIVPADTTGGGLGYFAHPEGLFGFTVDNPAPGEWKIVVDGSAAAAPQDYVTYASATTTSLVVLDATPEVAVTGTDVALTARLEIAGTPSAGASWNCTLTLPDASQLAVTLFDDGAHGDGGAGDGVFGATLPATQIGSHLLTADAADAALGAGVVIAGGGGYQVISSEDLYVIPSSLTLDAGVAAPGDTVRVLAMVYNDGMTAALGVGIEFVEGGADAAFADTTIDLLPQESRLVSARWVVPDDDTLVVIVAVDPGHFAHETDYANNDGVLRFLPGVPLRVDPNLTPGAWMRATPNPFAAATRLDFAIARRAGTRLEIVDLSGRRVRSWAWEALAPGRHGVTWDGRDVRGAATRPGVYWARLEVEGEVTSAKIVRLR